MYTYLDSAGNALVFSLDIVFSYNRVERRWINPPPLGPTVWFPFVGSYFIGLGLAGLDAADSLKLVQSVTERKRQKELIVENKKKKFWIILYISNVFVLKQTNEKNRV